MNRMTCCALIATAALFAAASPLPARAAPPATATADTITFEQYRDWRMHFVEQRQTQIAAELADKNLSAERRAGLERQKAYYDYFAAMPAAERDRRFRDRFDQIDANHDGVIDPAERTAWHEKQRVFYERPNTYRHQTAAEEGAAANPPRPRRRHSEAARGCRERPIDNCRALASDRRFATA